jgi:hypothetical protein
MLNLVSQDCKVEHVNFRTEKHGDEDVTAVDLKLGASLPPSILDQIAPEMREHFFKPANSSGAMKGEYALRCPNIENSFDVIGDWPGYKITIEWGMTGSLVEFGDCKLGKMKIGLIDGGAVALALRVQVSGKPEELARLVPLLNLTLPVTLTPPPAPELPDEHPDSRKRQNGAPKKNGNGKAAKNGGTEQPPIGEGGAPNDDQFAGTDLASDAAKSELEKAEKRGRTAGATAH